MTGTAKREGTQTVDTPEWAGLEPVNARQKAALQAYVDAINRQDLESLVALFAPDAVVEDPYGGTRHNIRGTEALREFYRFAVAKLRLELLLLTGSGGNAAAMAVRAHVGTDIVHNISVAYFDDDGKIAKYVTYWGPGDRTAGANTTGADHP